MKIYAYSLTVHTQNRLCTLLEERFDTMRLLDRKHTLLTVCLLDNFAFFCRLLIFFFKIIFFEKYFRNTIRVSNSLDPDQARRSVGPDLGPNCLKRLSADDTRRQRVNESVADNQCQEDKVVLVNTASLSNLIGFSF